MSQNIVADVYRGDDRLAGGILYFRSSNRFYDLGDGVVDYWQEEAQRALEQPRSQGQKRGAEELEPDNDNDSSGSWLEEGVAQDEPLVRAYVPPLVKAFKQERPLTIAEHMALHGASGPQE